jgi:hypothetical protein
MLHRTSTVDGVNYPAYDEQMQGVIQSAPSVTLHRPIVLRSVLAKEAETRRSAYCSA